MGAEHVSPLLRKVLLCTGAPVASDWVEKKPFRGWRDHFGWKSVHATEGHQDRIVVLTRPGGAQVFAPKNPT